MGTMHDILNRKLSTVHSVEEHATVLDAAQIMNDHKIGSVVVMKNGRMSGILTERDILTRIVAKRQDPETTRVAQVMTREVLTARPSMSANEARGVMREKRIRHLPVVQGDRVLGMVSIGDLNQAEHGVLVETIQSLEVYIAGGSAAPI